MTALKIAAESLQIEILLLLSLIAYKNSSYMRYGRRKPYNKQTTHRT